MNAIEFLVPWTAIGQYTDNLVKELAREASEGHPLWRANVVAIAQRRGSDDVLFEVNGGERFAVVHLTWSGKPEKDTRWPDTRLFDSLDAFKIECMNVNHAEFIGEN